MKLVAFSSFGADTMINFKLVAGLHPDQISNVNGGSLRENFECNTVHCCHPRLTLIGVTAATGT